MSDIKSYKEAWEKISSLANGGQGTTIKARNILHPEEVTALKILNRQDDNERRSRMHRETVALSTLNHPNLPKVKDYNTEYYKDTSYKLFIATEFIEGNTLSEATLENFSFEEKIHLILKICEIIEYCHKRGIIHRDIKPDNIILRNSTYRDPVILDFGISFNFNDSDDDTLTPDGQHLGNRFLILPEQKIGETSKRDMRSDITCITGLFYYILTNDFPVVLIDENEQKPHQRQIFKDIIDKFPKHTRDSLNYLFDIGFNQLIDNRWQTITSLIDQFNIVSKTQPPELNSINEKIDYIQSYYQKKTYIEARNLLKLKNEARSTYSNSINKINHELGDDWSGAMRLNGQSKFHLEGYSEVAIYSNTFLNISITVHNKIFTTGNELVIHSIMEGNLGSTSRLEVFREPLQNKRNWNNLEEVLKNEFISIVTQEILKND